MVIRLTLRLICRLQRAASLAIVVVLPTPVGPMKAITVGPLPSSAIGLAVGRAWLISSRSAERATAASVFSAGVRRLSSISISL